MSDDYRLIRFYHGDGWLSLIPILNQRKKEMKSLLNQRRKWHQGRKGNYSLNGSIVHIGIVNG